MPSFCLKFLLHLFSRTTICVYLCPCPSIIINSASSHSQKYPSLGIIYMDTFIRTFLSWPASLPSSQESPHATPHLTISTLVTINCLSCMFTFSSYPYFLPSSCFRPVTFWQLKTNTETKHLVSIFTVTPTHPPHVRKNTTCFNFPVALRRSREFLLCLSQHLLPPYHNICNHLLWLLLCLYSWVDYKRHQGWVILFVIYPQVSVTNS